MSQISLEAVITAKDEASSVISGVTSTLENAKGTLLGMGVAAGIALDGIVSFAKSSIDAANEAAKAQAQLGAVLTSTKGAAGETAEAAIGLSKALESTTSYSDETVLSAENLLLTFTNISSSAMPAATKATLDLATAMGEDTSSAAVQLGKALNNPEVGMTALQRVGVTFSASQKDVIKSMQDSGNMAGAQKVILDELAKEFGGSASAAADTFGGKQAQLANQINDVQESIGNALIPVLAQLLTAIVPIITAIGNWIEKHPELTKWIIILTGLVAGLTVGITAMAGAMLVFSTVSFPVIAIVLAIVVAITALIAIVVLLYTHWGDIVTFFKEGWAGIVVEFQQSIAAIIGFFQPLINVIDSIVSKIQAVGNGIASVANSVGGAVSSAVHAVIPHAGGGSVNPYGSYLVGENGPELFTPSYSGNIVPNGQFGGGGGNINITISGAVMTKDAANQMAASIMQQLKMKTRVGI